jgi:hypothetical protein
MCRGQRVTVTHWIRDGKLQEDEEKRDEENSTQ